MTVIVYDCRLHKMSTLCTYIWPFCRCPFNSPNFNSPHAGVFPIRRISILGLGIELGLLPGLGFNELKFGELKRSHSASLSRLRVQNVPVFCSQLYDRVIHHLSVTVFKKLLYQYLCLGERDITCLYQSYLSVRI